MVLQIGLLSTVSAPVIWFMIVGISFFAGATLPRTFRSLVPGGLWIWAPFLALGLLGLISDLQTLPKVAPETTQMVIAMWFYDTGNDEGARMVFITYPICSTLFYSLAVFLFARKAKERKISNE